ncbi:MAG: hypothetical protein ACTHZI_10590, partial [Luteimonas sp.]
MFGIVGFDLHRPIMGTGGGFPKRVRGACGHGLSFRRLKPRLWNCHSPQAHAMSPCLKISLPIALLATLFAAGPVQAQRAQAERAQRTTEIPVCSRSLGTIAVDEPPGRNWWTGQQLSSPSALIKLFVNRSRCFELVDRGRGMERMQAERDLAASGDLRGGSNIGRGQVRAADYVLVPDLISQNADSSGNR